MQWRLARALSMARPVPHNMNLSLARMPSSRVMLAAAAAVTAILALSFFSALPVVAADELASGEQVSDADTREDHLYQSAELLLPWLGDLEGMRDRGLVRVATTFSRTNFFLDEGRPHGVMYELMMAFRGQLREIDPSWREIDVVLLPMARDQIVAAVRDGLADIAAANLSVTPQREAVLEFTAPIAQGVRELVVSGPAGPVIESIEDLAGADIYVRASSSYHESLLTLAADFRARQLPPPTVHLVDENLETEDILELVARGVFAVTVADSSLTQLWADVLPELTVHEQVSLSEDRRIAWGLRPNSPQLAQAANKFINANRKGSLHGNILAKRYFQDNRWVRNPLSQEDTARLDELSAAFQEYAQRYGIDWLLSAAQAYQESGLDHSLVSAAGALGVMQLLPTTAADPNVGVADIDIVENNIHAGIKYKHFLRHRYFDDPDLDPLESWLFTIAAYNAGPAGINRYRHQAAARGLDPNRWFRHVEQVANRETRQYVSNIFKYYISYREYQRRVTQLKDLEVLQGASASR